MIGVNFMLVVLVDSLDYYSVDYSNCHAMPKAFQIILKVFCGGRFLFDVVQILYLYFVSCGPVKQQHEEDKNFPHNESSFFYIFC